MPKNIILYFVVLFLVIGSIFFLSSSFLNLQTETNVKKNSELIFEAKDISINLNFRESELLLKVNSKLINSKKNEKNLYVFEPEVSITSNDKLIKIKSKRGTILYDKNLVELNEGISLNGNVIGKKIFGETEKLVIDLNKKNLYSNEMSLYFEDFKFLLNEIILEKQGMLLKGSPIKLIQDGKINSETSIVKINLDGEISFPGQLTIKASN
ncbi:MAG: hypothetical protein DBW95_00210 [Gammaproteobacteria bacterium]|nr:MAG: hypothetical protein DBW95_00210 [Gammaproteobacteria bacterium]|tara:strand:- start:1048 stop:1680 length:633 start_codon:yes stop_codon:yes gene_type:complete